MPPGEEFRGRHRKRKLTVDAAATTDPDHQPPVKRRRPSRQSRSRTPPEFWDNLSRIPLCRRALREFNRRRARSPVPQPPVLSDINGHLVKQLKRFARRGGPDLRDIRGVGAYPLYGHPILIHSLVPRTGHKSSLSLCDEFEFPLKTFSRNWNRPFRGVEPD